MCLNIRICTALTLLPLLVGRLWDKKTLQQGPRPSSVTCCHLNLCPGRDGDIAAKGEDGGHVVSTDAACSCHVCNGSPCSA